MYNFIHHFCLMFLVLMYLDPYGWILKLSIEKLEITTMWSLFQFVFLSWMCVEGGCKVPARHCSRADTKWMGSCVAVWLQTRNFPANWKLLKGEGDAMVREGDLGSIARRYYPVFLLLPEGLSISSCFYALCSVKDGEIGFSFPQTGMADPKFEAGKAGRKMMLRHRGSVERWLQHVD